MFMDRVQIDSSSPDPFLLDIVGILCLVGACEGNRQTREQRRKRPGSSHISNENNESKLEMNR